MRPRPATRRPARALLIGAALLGASQAATPIVRAQRPERKQGVTVPGMDVSLTAGWKIVFHQGCRFMVPAVWYLDADGGVAAAADGSNISIRMFNVGSWTAHKGQIKAAFGQVNLMHEDSDRRLWLEIGDQRQVQHYVDVPNGTTVCSALLEIRRATASDTPEVARKIVESVGPISDKWPSEGNEPRPR
jgi:hypothetical protein